MLFPITLFIRVSLIWPLTFAEGVNYEELDAIKPEDLTEEQKIALLGRPRLGDVTKIQIRIKESKEFKVMLIGLVVNFLPSQ